MWNNANTNIERIIAKIDNDFNPDNSDWIPRVATWCIDVMSMLNVLRTERKIKLIKVKDRIAYSECILDKYNIKVFDIHKCQIKEADADTSCSNPSFTGEITQEVTPDTIDMVYHNDTEHYDFQMQSNNIQSKDYSSRYNVIEKQYNVNGNNRNYVIIDENKIELNFDTDYIYIEQNVVKTERSNMLGYDLPVIPNNALLIEAIVYYCMYKMLCRGYKHPIFNLHASQYGTNPKYEFEQLKDKAKRSVIINQQGDINDIDLWWSAFYLQTFKK